MKLKDIEKYNLADLADEGAEMEIIYPDGQPSGGFLRIVGKDSKIFQKRIRMWADRLRNKSARQIVNSDEDENLSTEDCIAYVIGWRGITDDAGKELEFSKDTIRELLSGSNRKWLREQINAFVGDRENFIKSNGKS